MKTISDYLSGPVYAQFEEFLSLKYSGELLTEEEKLDKFGNIFLMGLRKAREFYRIKQSCNLLFHDKRPRADMVQKLGFILFELQKIPSYPVVPPLSLRAAIKKIIISRDKRYMNKYQDWILSYSNHQPTFNKVDMTDLVNLFPKEKIVGKEFW
ncbi:MAG: hypothetical protein O6761_00375 [Thaumarchaeota archaeon]|nr:hypothetical protein [Nitrososphaerota archaeon]